MYQHTQIIGVTPEELADVVSKAVQKVVRELLGSSPATEDAQTFYTVQETAKFLSVTRQTIHEYVRTGKLAVHKIGARSYFMRADILAALQRDGYQRTPKTSRTHGRR